jgi:hypothetical protein
MPDSTETDLVTCPVCYGGVFYTDSIPPKNCCLCHGNGRVSSAERRAWECQQAMRKKKSDREAMWILGLAIAFLVGVGGFSLYHWMMWAHRYFDLAPVTWNPRSHEGMFYLLFLVLPGALFVIALVVLSIQAIWKRLSSTWAITIHHQAK